MENIVEECDKYWMLGIMYRLWNCDLIDVQYQNDFEDGKIINHLNVISVCDIELYERIFSSELSV